MHYTVPEGRLALEQMEFAVACLPVDQQLGFCW